MSQCTEPGAPARQRREYVALVDKTWTIIDIIRWGTQYFAEKQIDSPRLTIERMLCAAAQLERLDLYMKFDKPLSAGELAVLRNMVKRRLKREPLQYILGETEFYGLTIEVDSTVLIPRPETELIVSHILEHAATRGAAPLRILDIGTGSGCIPIALAHHLPECTVHAIDRSADCLQTAQKNALSNGCKTITFEICDILSSLPATKPFDIIVSNPPYVPREDFGNLQPEISRFEPSAALTDGQDGRSFYRRFAEIFPQLLVDSGYFCIEIGHGMERDVLNIFRENGFAVSSFKDYAGIPRCIYGGRSREREH